MWHGRAWKAWLQLIAVCAVLLVGMAAASPLHQHTVSGTNCDLCCAGHLPALQSPLLSDIRPAAVLDSRISAEDIYPSLDPQFAATFGRAPPF